MLIRMRLLSSIPANMKTVKKFVTIKKIMTIISAITKKKTKSANAISAKKRIRRNIVSQGTIKKRIQIGKLTEKF